MCRRRGISVASTVAWTFRLVIVRGIWGVGFAVVMVVCVVGCAPGTSSSDSATVTIASVIDGDTIETSAGTVRIIGIDAPERDVCGYAEASALVSSLLVPGAVVDLELPDGQNDADRHGRMLRYVTTDQGIDVASSLLAAGLAVARYDSADGYPAHPREADYRAAQVASIGGDGSVITVDCAGVAVVPPPSGEWWTPYTSCTKLKTNAFGHPIGPFSRDNHPGAYAWFATGTGNNGDGDGDGWACE